MSWACELIKMLVESKCNFDYAFYEQNVCLDFLSQYIFRCDKGNGFLQQKLD